MSARDTFLVQSPRQAYWSKTIAIAEAVKEAFDAAGGC